MLNMSWQPTSHDDYESLKGFDVYSSDNEKLGTITEVLHPRTVSSITATGTDRHYFLIDPGTLTNTKLFSDRDEVFVSEVMIREVWPQEDKVILSLTKDGVKDAAWNPPADLESFRRS